MDTAVVIVGDEILSGHVQDANSGFIASRVAHHGHRMRRIVVAPDDPAEIARDVRDCLAIAALVFVCGGVGPTHDDRTMEGVARALDVALEPCVPLAERIDEVIATVSAAGVSTDTFGGEGLRKMALAPAGAVVLPCSIGAIPAVSVAAGSGTVLVLPGPPRELQLVFTESVEPRYLAGRGEAIWREEITHPFPESVMAATLADLQARFPRTSIGSYPQPTEVIVRVAGSQEDVAAAAEALRASLGAFAASDDGKRLIALLAERRATRERR